MEYKIDIIISICLIILSFFLFKKFFYKKKLNLTNIDNNDEDDLQFQINIDKRSLRPSYQRFMRRNLQNDLNNHPYLCIICLNNKKNIVLLPCKHLCICLTCCQKLWNKNNKKETCPICRKNIDNILEVFI